MAKKGKPPKKPPLGVHINRPPSIRGSRVRIHDIARVGGQAVAVPRKTDEKFERAPESQRKSHRETISRLLAEGVTPLEVMMDNMRFAHSKAGVLLEKIVDKINKDTLDEEDKIVVLDNYKEHIRWRDAAQSCARDCAPYIHPRLSTVEVKEDPQRRIGVVKRVIVDPRDTGPGSATAEEVAAVLSGSQV